MSRGRLLTVILIGVVCFAAAAVAGRYFWPGTRTSPASSVPIGGAFTLVDQTGKTRTDKDFRGRLMLVYFGYTSCPDVCPTSLQTASEALEKLGKDAAKLQVLFVSVDPQRDTVARLARYHQAFDPRITMLTGTPKQVAVAAKAYRVYYAKRKQGEAADDYTMDHTAIGYLMDGKGRYLTHFPYNIKPDKLAAAIRKFF